MALGLRLDVRQSQGLVLTPQLQQAIRLLQLSSVDLQSEIGREVNENPFLNLAEASARAAGDGAASAPAPAAQAGAADKSLGVRRTSSGPSSEDLPSWESRLVEHEGLRQHLRRQLAAAGAPKPTRELADAMIDWLDEDGYLRESDEAVAGALFGAKAANGHAAEAEAAVAQARALLQGLDPAGVAARTLNECLSLQLRELDRLDPAMQAMLRHLDKVARAEWSALERLCKVDREDLQDMVRELRALDPRPGRRFPNDRSSEVVPDVVVSEAGAGSWRVELNPHVMPKLVVDSDYHAEIVGRCAGRDQKEFVAERFQSANWLARALQQRSSTILKVAKVVFTRQKAFLERGQRGLRPLTLKDVSAATGLHESTVSRATADKYVQTPLGTYPFKFFFTNALPACAEGGGESGQSIREQIRQLIAKEDPAKVLSDDQIVGVLKQQGIEIARRTVAKYREGMNIPSSVNRRRLKSLR